jgi:transcriptional regulator with XRE-family HTH domain
MILSDVIGERVRSLRTKRRMTAQQLADRCAAEGAPNLTAAVITNIETGRRDAGKRRRRDVTADEMCALAYALNCAPVLLLLPEDGGNVPITTSVERHPASALAWFSGEVEPEDSARRDEWREVMAPVGLYRALREYTYRTAHDEALEGRSHRPALRELARVVDLMIDQGLRPFPLPGDWVLEMRREGWLKRPDEVPLQSDDDGGDRGR